MYVQDATTVNEAKRLYVVGRCFPCAMYVQDATTVNDAVAERWSVVLQSGAKANDPPLLRRVPLRP
jgi:hypothetical protein